MIARPRIDDRSAWGVAERVVLFFSITLVRLPAIAPPAQERLVALACLAPILLIVAGNLGYLLLGNRLRLNRSIAAVFSFTVLCMILLASFVQFMLRGPPGSMATGLNQLVLWSTCSAFLFLIFARRNSEAQRTVFVHTLLAGIAFFVALNVALHFLEVDSPEQTARGKAVILSLLGLNVGRVRFPLASGYNGFGVLAAAVMVAYAISLTQRTGLRAKMQALLVMGSSLAALLLVDNRAGLVLVLVALALYFALANRGLRWLAWAPPAIAAATSFVILFGLPVSGGDAFSLERKAGEFTTLNGRTNIWAIVWQHLSEPRPEHLFGFGFRGQVSSGLVNSYAHFLADSRIETTTGTWAAHNGFLQSILDFGYIGVLVLFGCLAAALWCWGRHRTDGRLDAAYMAALVVVLSAFMEVTILPQTPETFYLILAVLCVWVTSPEHRLRTSTYLPSSTGVRHGSAVSSK